MAGLYFVGKEPAVDQDLMTREDTEAELTSGLSRSYVDGRVPEIIANYAPKTYVDGQDELYAPSAYYPAQDALLVPNAARGAANGVSSLDGSSKVPVAQMPVLGVGMIKGPWGYSQSFGGTTSVTPLKIAQWTPGATGVQGQPLVWMVTSAQSTNGRPVVEVRVGDTTQTTYASQTLIAQGFGRAWYNDYQVITVSPCAANSEGQDGVQDSFSPATNLLVNAWIYDSEGGSVTTTIGSIVTGALFLARTAL